VPPELQVEGAAKPVRDTPARGDGCVIKVICRKCGTHLNARDTSAGHRAPCPTCGTLLRVPASPASAPAAGAAAAPRPAPAGKPAAAGEPAAAPDPAPAAPPAGQPAGHGGLAIAGFACGIASAVLVLVPCIGLLAIPVALAGLVLSLIALVTAKKAGRKKGLAVAGLVLSLLVPVLYVIMISVIAGVLGTAASTLPVTGAPAEPSAPAAPSASLAQVGRQLVA